MARIKWAEAPQSHDYPAADSYLSLLIDDPELRAAFATQLQAAPIVHFKAKDLLRASQLALLGKDNAEVAADLKKARDRQPLSPVLLVRGDLVRGFPLQVADGYHRICASYYVDENTDIPCRLIDLLGAHPAASPLPPVAADDAPPPAPGEAPQPVTTKRARAKTKTADDGPAHA
jgi:hypothetical protein